MKLSHRNHNDFLQHKANKVNVFFSGHFIPNGVNRTLVLCPWLHCRYTGGCSGCSCTLFKTKSTGKSAIRRAQCWSTETFQHPASTYYLL